MAEVIRYVLFKTHQSSGCPIRREELTQIVTKNYHQRSLPTLVINEARGKLSSIFGFEMKELNRMRPSSNRSAARASQQSELLLFYIKLHEFSLQAEKCKKPCKNESGFLFSSTDTNTHRGVRV